MSPRQNVSVRAAELFDFSAGCRDTSSGGCDSIPTPGPAKGVSLLLRQGSRHWTLATGDAAGTNPSIVWQVVLPIDLKPGTADLGLNGATLVAQTHVQLRVQR